MADRSSGEWTEATWNPVTGCRKVSPGCAHCYAQRFAERFRGVPGHDYENGFDVRIREDLVDQPLSWREPRTVLVNSMSDLFLEDLTEDYIARVFDVMRRAHWHTFQVLTKRSERLAELAPRLPWPPNVWMGVSIENQRWISRIDDLRTVPAVVRFLSCEPLLGPLELDLAGVDWVIVGGEIGLRARPMRGEWAERVLEQCREAGVPFFFNQWGEHDAGGALRGESAAGRELLGALWNEMPVPEQRFAPRGWQR